MQNNLNKIKIPGDQYCMEYDLKDYSLIKNDLSVYFKDIKQHLIENIKKYEIVLGCIAWLTDFDILNALSEKQTSIIVQKEDFLRPDLFIHDRFDWKKALQSAYSKLKFRFYRFNFENSLIDMSYAGDTSIEPVRCVGNYNKDKKPAFPRMHNKFLVFCNLENNPSRLMDDVIVPKAVWTGSFNFTKNAQYSFENALLIKDIDISRAYYDEFGQIASLSEPLDWNSEWIEPEWRIGS